MTAITSKTWTLREEVDRARALLAAIVESSNDAAVSVRPDGVITSWNPAATELFGYAASEAVGRPLALIVPPEGANELAELLRRAGRGERIRHHPTVRHRKDGTLVSVSVSLAPLRDAGGELIGISAVLRDLTHLRAAERNEALLAAIVASSNDAIVSKRLDGTIVSWNAAAERLFGYTATEAIGQSIMILMPEASRDEERMLIKRIEAGERVEHYETVRRTKGGSEVHVSLSLSPIRDASGAVIAIRN